MQTYFSTFRDGNDETLYFSFIFLIYMWIKKDNLLGDLSYRKLYINVKRYFDKVPGGKLSHLKLRLQLKPPLAKGIGTISVIKRENIAFFKAEQPLKMTKKINDLTFEKLSHLGKILKTV